MTIPLRIVGVGRYLPERVVTNAELEARCGLRSGWIERRTGVRERRWVSGETNSTMAAAAVREAVANANMQLTDIDLIINASGTAEQAIPDGGPLIQQQLGLGCSGIPCISLHATCLSFLVALDASASMLASKRFERIIIVSSDIGSVALNMEEPESAALIGDAAAAVVVRNACDGEASCILAARMETYGEGTSLAEIRGGGTRKPPDRPGTTPEDHLFHMDGRAIYRLAQRRLGPFLERLRPGLSSDLGSVKLVIPHQPSKHGLDSVRRFGWPEDRVVRTLDRFGNCVSTSLPLTLYEAVQQTLVTRGDELLLIGTGAGVSIGAVILTY